MAYSAETSWYVQIPPPYAEASWSIRIRDDIETRWYIQIPEPYSEQMEWAVEVREPVVSWGIEVPEPYAEMWWNIEVLPGSITLPWGVRIPISLSWPVAVAIGTRWGIDLPIGTRWAVEVDRPLLWGVKVEADIYSPDLRWAVAVGVPRTVTRPWPVQVLDQAAVGDLDGSGTWAATPDGRWSAVAMLDSNTDISHRLTGVITVTAAADSARTAEFSLLPESPIQPMDLIGRPVRLAFAQAGGANAQTIFRGVIDEPRIDLTTGVIRCICHDQAQEIISRIPREEIDAAVGGRWHLAVSGEPEDNYEYLRERIQSVGKSWALDTNQSLQILDWASGARTLTVRTADVIDGTLSVDLPSREQLRTRIVVRMQYRYPVLRGRGIRAQYELGVQFFMPVLGGRSSRAWLTTDMVRGAAGSPQGWLLDSLAIDHPRPGAYPLGPSINDGQYIIRDSVAPSLATGFRGRYSARWQQSVTEDYSLAVVWSGLEARLGEISEEMGATLESRFDSPDWGSSPATPPVLEVPDVGDVVESWESDGAAAGDRDEALLTLLDRAWVRLWSASRTGRVRFSLPCRPDVWLDDWFVLEHSHLRSSGRASELTHTLDLSAGSAVTAVTFDIGLPGAEPSPHPDWSLPETPFIPSEPPLSALSPEIGTFVGGTELAPPWDDSWTGFSTNAEGGTSPGYNYYPHQLSIGWPEIEAEARDPVEAEHSADYPVSIPTSLLEVMP